MPYPVASNPFVTTLALEFLAPVTGLIGAAIAIPAFLFFYFLKLRRRPLRVSSTMFWEQAVSDLQVNAPFRWIRPSLLLFIQLLALICLLLALARPAIEGGIAASRVILAIDASASMRTRDAQDGPTRFDRAIEEASEYVSSLPPETEVMVVSVAGSTRTVTNFTRNRGLIQNALTGLRATDQPATLREALDVLAAFAVSSGEAAPVEPTESPPRVVLFSDGAFPDSVEERAVAGIEGLEFEYRRLGPERDTPSDNPAGTWSAAPNIAVVGLSVRRDLDDPELIRVFTRLQSTDPVGRAVPIRCTLDGEVVAVESTRLAPATAEDPTGERVPVTDATFSFDIRSMTGGLLAISIAVDDALESDNRAWLTLPEPEAVRILMIRADGPLSNGSANLAFALETVFPEPQEVRVVTEQEASRSRLLESASDDGYDLLVFDGVSPARAPDLPSLFFNGAPGLAQVRLVADAEGGSSEFLFWRRSHPLMRNVVPDGVVIYRRPRLILEESPPVTAGDEQSPIVQVTELASDPDPLIALVEYARTRAAIVAFDLDATNWWQDRSFPIFIQNAVDYLTRTGDATGGPALTTGQPIRLNPDELTGGATIVNADGDTVTIPAPQGPEAIVIPPLPRVGLYELLPAEGAQAGNRILAVSLLNPFESLSAAAPTLELGGEVLTSIERDAEARREIWDWFVLIAAGLLVVEWLLFDRKMRV
jgi:hypothetical protein